HIVESIINITCFL
ncbi:unnamed protein product, partial [Rotaria socialis]